MTFKQLSGEEQNAIDAFTQQLSELTSIRPKGVEHLHFSRWKMATAEIFRRFMPGTTFLAQFANISFKLPRREEAFTEAAVSERFFIRACDKAQSCLEAAISDIQRFGLKSRAANAQPISTPAVTDASVNYYGQVIIGQQAIATGDAVQNIDQTMTIDLTSLSAIKELMQRSEELKGREVREALEAIERIAAELRKSEKGRDWKGIVKWAGTVISLGRNAVDMTESLSKHMRVIVSLYDHARMVLGM